MTDFNALIDLDSIMSSLESFEHLKDIAEVVLIGITKYKEHNLLEFFKCININLETMTEEKRIELKIRVNSEEGKKLLAKYIEEATHVDSEIARMALALLVCKDPDFIFENYYERVLLTSLKDLDDSTIIFFIDAATNIEINKIDKLPYDRVVISSDSKLISKGWNPEDISILVNYLKNLSLLLPDPCSSSPYAGRDDTWMVEYGISDNTKKIASLFNKARSLCR